MILPADHVLRAVINARLLVPLLLLVCFWSYLFHVVTLPYQVGDVPLTCIAAVDYVSGIHVASSDYWLASFFARLFKMTNFVVKHSIMTREMVENFCNDHYIPDEVHPVAPGRDKTITQFPEGKVDAKVFPIPVSLYVGGVLEKDPAPYLTARQEHTVRLLENNKAPFRLYPECFLCLVVLSPYYPFNENTYPAFERHDGTEMGLLDFIKTTDPRKVQAVEVQKKDDQVKLLESTSHCFMSLVTPYASGSSFAAAPEVSAPAEVELEYVVPEDTYLDLTKPDADVAAARPEKFATTQSGKSKRKRLVKQSDTLPAKLLLPADIQAHVVVQSTRTADVPVYTAAATLPVLNSAEIKCWYVPRWNITNDSLLDDGFSCRTLVDRVAPPGFFSTLRSMDYEQLYTEFNVRAARQICLESEVRSRAEHELELKEKLKGKYDARGRLLEEKELEILILKSLLTEEAEKTERAKTAEVDRLRDQVSALTAEVSVLKSTIAQKDTDISLLDSRATYLKSALDDSQAACAEAGSLIISLTFERDRLTSKRRRKLNRKSRPRIQLAVLKCLKSPEYQGILGHALGHAMDFGMQEGLEAGYEHGSKKDAGIDEVLYCFILDEPLADLPETAHLQPCLKQLSVPIHHSDDKAIAGETSLS
ncbi:hypothetical protein Tco_1298552, partial [Tanacetum coccineum]